MGIIDQMKQVMQARSDMKKVQAALENISATHSNGGVTVTARGDFSISSIKISPETWAEAAGGKPEHFETMLFNVVNAAIAKAKKEVQEYTTAALKNGGMPSLFGG